MKRNIIVGVLVVVVIVLGVIYWPSLGRAPERPTSPAASSTAALSTTTSTSSSTLTAVATSSSNGNGLTVTNTLGWKKYMSSKYGITLSYPADWQIGSEQPIILDNFNNKFQGNIMPLGGAEIDIVATVTSGPVDNIINTELMNASIVSTSTIPAAGVSCKEFFYGGTYAQNISSKNIAVYCPGKMLLKIFLSYRASDPKGASFEATFKQILGTIEFVK